MNGSKSQFNLNIRLGKIPNQSNKIVQNPKSKPFKDVKNIQVNKRLLKENRSTSSLSLSKNTINKIMTRIFKLLILNHT